MATIPNNINRDPSTCIVVPTYNNEKTIKRVIDGIIKIVPHHQIIVVNDGCTDGTPSILEAYNDQLIILINDPNQGKGIALQKAFKKAFKLGYQNAITIDSDGQHYPEDIPLFLKTIQENPGALIMGSRNMDQESVPGKSSFGNKFSNFWFKVETGITLPDTQTGFRSYPLEPISKMKLFTSKFETEIEVIVKLAWKNVKIIPISIQVLYDPDERISHFRPLRDFTRISILNTYLVTLTLLYYLPKRALNIVKREAIKSEETNFMKALSIAFGVFMGIVPLWGFQLLIGIPLSILFKMNKVLFIAAANISLPPLIPIIIYLSYLFGSPFVEKTTTSLSLDNLTLESIHLNFLQYVIGAIILAICASVATFITSYVSLMMFRKNK